MAAAPKARHSPDVDTAFHVLKGAIVSVLHTPLTDSVQFQSDARGKLTVQYLGEAEPPKEAIAEIERLANEKIESGIELQEIVMSRKEAEDVYKANPVNETYIYDRAGVRPDVHEVTLTLLHNWNVNCCRGPHTPPRDLTHLNICGVTHRKGKKQLEFAIVLSNDGVERSVGVEEEKMEKKERPKKETVKNDAKSNKVVQVKKDPLSLRREELYNDLHKACGLEKSVLESIVAPHLTDIQNLSYTEGFHAYLTHEEERAVFFGK